MSATTPEDVAGGGPDCDGCTRWGMRYHELQQDLQQKLIELNDKRIAAEARAAELEAALRPFAKIGTDHDRRWDYYTSAARFVPEIPHAQIAAARSALGMRDDEEYTP